MVTQSAKTRHHPRIVSSRAVRHPRRPVRPERIVPHRCRSGVYSAWPGGSPLTEGYIAFVVRRSRSDVTITAGVRPASGSRPPGCKWLYRGHPGDRPHAAHCPARGNAVAAVAVSRQARGADGVDGEVRGRGAHPLSASLTRRRRLMLLSKLSSCSPVIASCGTQRGGTRARRPMLANGNANGAGCGQAVPSGQRPFAPSRPARGTGSKHRRGPDALSDGKSDLGEPGLVVRGELAVAAEAPSRREMLVRQTPKWSRRWRG